VQVLPVQGEDALWEFLRLPWRLYRHDPCWVPPLLGPQRHFLDPRRGPFFEIGEAQYFLAWRQGRPAGRLSAHINHLYEARHDRDTGFFGFFECLPDLEVAGALFAAAADWLRPRGKKRLIGPLNFSIYDEMGLLVTGFDSPPALFQTHNPPYYQELLAALGFRKTFDWHAFKITQRDLDIPALERLLAKILQGQNLVITTFNRRELDRRAKEVYHLFNQAWSSNWGHVPLTRRQFQHLFQELKPLLRPELVNLVLDGDRLAAFSLVVPDLNPLVRKLDGRLGLGGRLRLYWAARFQPLKKARALVLGVAQPYQGRRLHHAMIIRTYLNIVQQTPCEFCDFSLVPENLHHYIKVLESFGARHYKTFRLLERDL
jgi:hypothetical protein